MPAPIALQLYSLRDSLPADFEGVIRRVAEIGYAGVETAGFPGTTPQAAAQLFRSLGLEVPSAHAPLPLGERKNEVLDAMAALGCKRIVCGGVGAERFKTLDGIRRVCDDFNQSQAVAAANGLSFGVHTHWWEFEQVEGRYAYEHMLELLDPAIFFELDTYWIQTAGLDPVAIVKEFGRRASLLHIKDGPCVRDLPMVAVGQGKVDVSAVIAAGKSAEWLIVELDRCATDMMTAVEQSYEYLVGEGLARGR